MYPGIFFSHLSKMQTFIELPAIKDIIFVSQTEANGT
jgi:hypothetical protein